MLADRIQETNDRMVRACHEAGLAMARFAEAYIRAEAEAGLHRREPGAVEVGINFKRESDR